MKQIDLSRREKTLLELQHKTCSNKKVCDRIKAVLLYSEGWRVSMISQALRIHESSANRHLNDYVKGKLKPENGGSESALNEAQSTELMAHLEEHIPMIIEDACNLS